MKTIIESEEILVTPYYDVLAQAQGFNHGENKIKTEYVNGSKAIVEWSLDIQKGESKVVMLPKIDSLFIELTAEDEDCVELGDFNLNTDDYSIELEFGNVEFGGDFSPYFIEINNMEIIIKF